MTNRFPKTPTFSDQSPVSAINVVVPRLIVFPAPSEAHQSGTCCRIAKNLYVTAAHVVLDWITAFGTEGREQNLEIWAVHVDTGPKYSIWSADRTWTNPYSDLAVIHTKPYNDVAAADSDAGSATMQLVPPRPGERIVGFGHYCPDQSITVDKAGTRHIVVNAKGAATVGEVKEVHGEARDSARLRFPCFRVNARFDGGMSGGPIFNSDGHLCGVICSNLPPNEDSEEHVSYAASLWPLMGTLIDVAPDGGVVQNPYPLLELARSGTIHAIGHERIQLDLDQSTGDSTIRLI